MESFVEQPDGSLLFSAGFTSPEMIIGWIASFGSGAKLLEPEELRMEVLAFAEGICKNYTQPS